MRFVRKTSHPGQNDDSFGNGTKEDTAVSLQSSDGSIPPNKSDLTAFGVYQEENADGNFLHLFWTRVQEPNGTTNMDFEFNQSSVISANGVTPVRTPGDLLIVYELSKGGTVPELFLFTWLDGSEGLNCDAANSFPCWGDRTDLDAAGLAAGSINTSPIPANESDGLGALSPFTFGEATVNLDFIFDPNICESFGSAYLKSRSSDSFTAALKDFIAPASINITNCGSVIIRKETNPEEDPNSTMFDYTSTLQTEGQSNPSFQLMDDGSIQFANVLFDSGYTVTEDDPSNAGYQLQSIDCSASVGVSPSTDVPTRTVTFDIDDPDDVVDCTFINQALGEIIIDKVTDPAGDEQLFDFTLTGGPSALNQAFQLADATTPHNSGPVISGSGYSAAESVPVGWDLDSATCDDGSPVDNIDVSAGETVTCTFTNVKRGTIIVVKNTVGGDGTFDFTSGTLGDFSLTTVGGTDQTTFDDLVPGTYDVAENDPGPEFTLTGATCDDGSDPSAIELDPGETVTCTFTNERNTGAIKVIKQAKNFSEGGLAPLAGATFEINGQEVVTDANGEACVDGLIVGQTYTVTETAAPDGYALADPVSQDVLVTQFTDCGSGNEDTTDPFENVPLSEITVTFTSLAGDGVTAASIECTGPSGEVVPVGGDATPGAFDDDAETFTDLPEGTYTCTIVVDP